MFEKTDEKGLNWSDNLTKSQNRLLEGLRTHIELGIIYFSWHAARIARWRACKYYATIAQIRTEDVAESVRQD